VEGTGIGLTMVKQLTDMMGGTVFVESVVGQGSHFYVEFLITKGIHDQPGLMQEISGEQNVPQKSSYKILYVEDNPANQLLIQQLFKPFSFIDLSTASTAQEGLSISEHTKLDIVLLDIDLPDMNGYDLFQSLRKIPDLTDTFIIAISANAMEKDIEKALSMGFYDYITKPIDVTVFTEKIMNLLFKQKNE
jgi:CheY-like chemotaxis protein